MHNRTLQNLNARVLFNDVVRVDDYKASQWPFIGLAKHAGAGVRNSVIGNWGNFDEQDEVCIHIVCLIIDVGFTFRSACCSVKARNKRWAGDSEYLSQLDHYWIDDDAFKEKVGFGIEAI